MRVCVCVCLVSVFMHVEKHNLAERLEGAQGSLILQEEAVLRGDRLRGMMEEELSRLKTSLQAAEANVRTRQVTTTKTPAVLSD